MNGIEFTKDSLSRIEEIISCVPDTDERVSTDPKKRAERIANSAAVKSGVVSAGLALPPGALGLITIFPELMAIWRIQAGMVADIAGAYGKTPYLSREQMFYCLFRHAASQAVRDFIVRGGERVIIKRVSSRLLQDSLQRVGIKITQRIIAKTGSRFLPLLGAVGVGVYAHYDTKQVARTAIEIFSQDLEFDSTGMFI